MKERNGFFKSYDGTKLFYSIEGEGPPLVFCYGLVCSKLHWSYQMDYFKKNHTVVWFDYRGHHNSSTPTDLKSLTISSIAQDLECLLNELDIPQATVLGHSMGVNVVLDLYRRAPKRVKALVLANGSARDPMETFFGSNFMQYIIPLIERGHGLAPSIFNYLWSMQSDSKLAHKLISWGGFNPGLTKESDIATYIKMFSAMDISVTLNLLRDYEHYDGLSWLHKVKVPTLVIAGENDKVIPKEAQELIHQLIPNSRFELIRNGSHCPQMDIPELVNIMIERFFNDLS